jgi:hypothetical protein
MHATINGKSPAVARAMPVQSRPTVSPAPPPNIHMHPRESPRRYSTGDWVIIQPWRVLTFIGIGEAHSGHRSPVRNPFRLYEQPGQMRSSWMISPYRRGTPALPARLVAGKGAEFELLDPID